MVVVIAPAGLCLTAVFLEVFFIAESEMIRKASFTVRHFFANQYFNPRTGKAIVPISLARSMLNLHPVRVHTNR